MVYDGVPDHFRRLPLTERPHEFIKLQIAVGSPHHHIAVLTVPAVTIGVSAIVEDGIALASPDEALVIG